MFSDQRVYINHDKVVIFHLAKRHIAMASMASTARRAAQHQLKRPNVGRQDLLSEVHPLEEKNPTSNIQQIEHLENFHICIPY